MLIQNKIANPLKGWQVDRNDIRYLGHDLQRPECILAEPNGTIWTADARGGVMQIQPDGSQQLITPVTPSASFKARGAGGEVDFEKRYVQSVGSLPNGLCFDGSGEFIIANWGTDAIESMTRDGHLTTLCTKIDGQPLGKANFPLRDSKGRIWFTVTTRTQPWTAQLNTKASDGYIAVMDANGVRIVADGFCGTNEIRFDTAEEWLYVVESTGHKISRLRLQPDGSLTDREVYGPNDLGGFPDGFSFDAFGNLWITLIFTDELIALTPDGAVLTLLDDSTPDTKKLLLDQFATGTLTPEVMGATHGTIAPWMASLTFGGPDLQTVYLGSLRGTTVPYFRSPVVRTENDSLAMSNLFDLTGKVALITGSSSGMGRAIAEAMGQQGATVIVSSNDEAGCESTVAELSEKDITAVAIPCDIAKKEAVQMLYQTAITQCGKIDVLVSCVGMAPTGSFLDITAADFEQIMALNLQSAIYLTKLVLPQMVERRDGVLIYLGSIAGIRGNKHIGLYGLSKAALIQMARNLAVEYGPDNIRANTISPGMIDTPFSTSLLENSAFMEKRLALTPLRRVGQPHEIAGVAVLLASRAGAFITGQNSIVDGGTVVSDGN